MAKITLIDRIKKSIIIVDVPDELHDYLNKYGIFCFDSKDEFYNHPLVKRFYLLKYIRELV